MTLTLIFRIIHRVAGTLFPIQYIVRIHLAVFVRSYPARAPLALRSALCV